MIKTIDATHDDGAFRLAEPLDPAPRSGVRVRIEIPPGDSSADLLAKLNEAFAEAPDEDERTLQKHMAHLCREQAEEWWSANQSAPKRPCRDSHEGCGRQIDLLDRILER